jgi:hypothetical protein
VRENPNQPGDYDLFFNLGSRVNFAPTTDQVPLSGLVSGLVNGDAIYKVTVHDTGTVPVFYGLQQIATGLRNAAGIVVEPASGDLYFEDNGIDGLADADEPTSADEINRIAAADVGTGVFNFGFPNDYIEYRTSRRIGSGGIQPLVAFQPLPDPLNGSESEGPAEIALAPTGFPAGLNHGIFVGFHGRFDFGGLYNEENPVVYYDLDTGAYFHFIENDEPRVGHLDTMLATNDSLFLADVSSTGSMETGAGSGVIYQIKAISPQPMPASNKQPAEAKATNMLDALFAIPASRRAALNVDVTGSQRQLIDDRPRSVPLQEMNDPGHRLRRDAHLWESERPTPGQILFEKEVSEEIGIMHLPAW